PAEPVRRHRILQRHTGRDQPPRADVGETAAKVAPLPIAERTPLPAAAADQAQRCVGTVGAVRRKIGSARPPVVESGEVRLELGGSADRRDPARAAIPVTIRRALVGRAPGVFSDWYEPVTAL